MQFGRCRGDSTFEISKVSRFIVTIIRYLNGPWSFRLYDKLNETENAAAAFTEYCLREEDDIQKDTVKGVDSSEFYNALQYLANYHLKKDELDNAYTYAYKCMECEEVIFLSQPIEIITCLYSIHAT